MGHYSAMTPKAPEIVALQDRLVAEWHQTNPVAAEIGIMGIVRDQHLRNFRLWHVEDEARRRDVDDAYIADCKRQIDKINQSRQDHIEKIDEALIAAIGAGDEALPTNSETPGSIIDRLSIGALKIYHMNEEVVRADADDAHRQKCADKVLVLRRQRNDLAEAFDQLMVDLRDGRKRLNVYRQFKMYNDPTLNPAVYRKNS